MKRGKNKRCNRRGTCGRGGKDWGYTEPIGGEVTAGAEDGRVCEREREGTTGSAPINWEATRCRLEKEEREERKAIGRLRLWRRGCGYGLEVVPSALGSKGDGKLPRLEGEGRQRGETWWHGGEVNAGDGDVDFSTDVVGIRVWRRWSWMGSEQDGRGRLDKDG
ncbi:hypothetical protein OsI_33161 [Oryza sativa Indica Group]|uniref:Uncharacterized protein n=1 Tax=Oryza sativa subsp. indica TaxID=39946 RepID=B8BGC2_ORYSI|nr:hypothetical protein OsI_33161 [Oryza sativa Indica Group]